MAWVGAVISWVSSIWGYVKAIGTVIYVYNLWQASNQHGQSPTYGFNMQTQCSNELPIPIVYGRVKCPGNVIWRKVSADQKTIYLRVAFASGKIEGFEDIR